LLFTAYIRPSENHETLSKYYYSDLFIVNVDGNDLQNLTNLDTQNDDYGKWSPDGKRIAFTSSRDGNPEIYIMDSDGSNIKRITNNEGDDYVECWLEDLSADIEHIPTSVS
jgi:Tol biopolymer transport system component